MWDALGCRGSFVRHLSHRLDLSCSEGWRTEALLLLEADGHSRVKLLGCCLTKLAKEGTAWQAQVLLDASLGQAGDLCAVTCDIPCIEFMVGDRSVTHI